MQASASAVLYLGDDITDENVFAQLHGPDVGIKIGAGDTLATHRVGRTRSMPFACSGFCSRRAGSWLYGEHAVPIERHSMLSNGSTVALLAPDAKVTLAVPPSAGFGGDLRRHPRRRPSRVLLRRAGPATAFRSASGTGRER